MYKKLTLLLILLIIALSGGLCTAQKVSLNITESAQQASNLCKDCHNKNTTMVTNVTNISNAKQTYADAKVKVDKINAHNKEFNRSWTAAVNPMMLLTPEEREHRNGLNHKNASTKISVRKKDSSFIRTSVPDSFDWRNNNGDWTTPIRDQGNCGSCWAFAITGVFESYYELKQGNSGLNPNFAEQYLVNCADSESGCDGGEFKAMAYLVDTEGSSGGIGTVLETAYPYTESTGTCKSLTSYTRYKVDTSAGEDWYYAGEGSEYEIPSEADIKNAVYSYGPVTAGVYAGDDFDSYESGIFDTSETSSYTNHAVIIVGWGSSNGRDYWICKNSWGTSWGESGWFKIYTDIARIGEGAAYFKFTPASSDTTPPRSVTNLVNVTFLSSSINWTWTDPTDSDFSKVMVYVNNAFKTNVTKATQYYTATGLSASTQYVIGTRTVDTTGNINTTWVNRTTRTAAAPDTTPPRSVTNLVNVTFLSSSINWTWTDPTDSDFSKVMVYVNNAFKTNVTKATQYYIATGLSANTQYVIGTRTVDTTGNINTTWVNRTTRTAAAPDTTPPRSITNLINTTFLSSSINWIWTDPTDSDFSKVMVYVNSAFKTNVTKATQYYTATGLSANTQYVIGTRTVDTTGNINTTWVNRTTRTAAAPDTTPPRSITNLINTTFLSSSINWTWTDPTDSDFSKVMVYVNSAFKTNVTKATQYYTATGLSTNTQYTMATRTVDTFGNINQTFVNHTAYTSSLTPTITSVSPIVGYLTQSWPVTIRGTNFRPNATVTISNSSVSKTGTITSLSTTQIVCILPISQLSSGAYEITVQNEDLTLAKISQDLAPVLFSYNN